MGLFGENQWLFVGHGGHRLSDIVELPLECEAVESFQWQAEQEADSALENKKRIAKRPFDFRFGSMNGRWVWNTPMGGHRLSGPDWANLFRRVVTNRKNKVEIGRARQRKFIPCFAAQTLGWQVGRF